MPLPPSCTYGLVNRTTYPEQRLGHRLLHCLREGPKVVIQRRVHHARVHSVDGHRGTGGCQLLLKVVGEEDQSQLTLGVGPVGTVANPRDEKGRAMRE